MLEFKSDGGLLIRTDNGSFIDDGFDVDDDLNVNGTKFNDRGVYRVLEAEPKKLKLLGPVQDEVIEDPSHVVIVEMPNLHGGNDKLANFTFVR